MQEFVNVDLGLTTEQEIDLQCVAQTGGQPWAADGCAVLAPHLERVVQVLAGIGGDGCFGDSNDLVGKDGWTARTLRNIGSHIGNGPGESNDVFGEKGWMAQTFGFHL